MAEKKRTYLKSLFGNGKRPKVSDFEDLIDSSFNLQEDGINRTDEHGYELSPRSQNSKTSGLLSFFEKIGAPHPLLSIQIKLLSGGTTPTLVFKSNFDKNNEEETEDEILYCTKKGHLGIHISDEKQSLKLVNNLPLSVGKIMGQSGRMGIHKIDMVNADGKYHTILPDVANFQGFEIIACLQGPEHSGKHAMTHAIAICTNKHTCFNRIRQTHAFSGWPWNRLKLRWKKIKGKDKDFLTLQIKSRTNYLKYLLEGQSFKIKYHITQLGGLSELNKIL